MINEFIYCPRLFYLEWVQGRFAHNEETRTGQLLHRHIDTPAGAAPLPGEGRIRTARSVTMSSQVHGVIAKFDILEGDGDTVSPVDYKIGHPQPDGTPWPGDVAQVCVQALILRDNGYRCDHAEIYYDQTRRRVRVELTEERIAEVTNAIAAAIHTARQTAAPLPLVNSPKCAGCSLVGLCLPDETNELLDRSQQSPRRLVPSDPDQKPVYITEPGSFVGIRGTRLEISRDSQRVASIRLIDVSQLVIFGYVQVSTQALHACFAKDIPILWMSSGGWLKGFAVCQPVKYAELRRRQTAVHAQGGNALANRMIAGKIANSRTLLRRNTRVEVSPALDAMKALAEQARQTNSFASLLGIEGAAARLYFNNFPAMMSPTCREFGEEFSQRRRNRRPPTDPVNALLSFCYALLQKTSSLSHSPSDSIRISGFSTDQDAVAQPSRWISPKSSGR